MCISNKFSAGCLFTLLLFAAIPAMADVSFQQRVSAGLNLISIGVETDRSPKSLFGDNLVAIWERNAKRPSFSIPDKLIPGIGYWAVMRDEEVVTISGMEVRRSYRLDTPKGRNLRGNPFHQPLAWKEVTFCLGGECLTPDQARAVGWVRGVHTLSAGRWKSPDLVNGILAQGAGFLLDLPVKGVSLEFHRTQDWTIMLYLDGDDPAIQSDMLDAFADMTAKSVGSNAQVTIVAQFDRLPDNPSYGGWSIAHRFFVTARHGAD